MKTSCFEIRSLPDIDMYGGDTTPWEIFLVHENGDILEIDEELERACTLTLGNYNAKALATNNGSVMKPIWVHSGAFGISPENNRTFIHFDFTPEDTANLRGKFLYQVDVLLGNNVRVCQGVVNIKQNINGGTIKPQQTNFAVSDDGNGNVSITQMPSDWSVETNDTSDVVIGG